MAQGWMRQILSGLAWSFPFHHRPWLAFFRAMGLMLATTLILIAHFVFLLYEAKPGPTLDYLPQVNAFSESVPMEDRAWRWYRKALVELFPKPVHENAPHYLSNFEMDTHALTDTLCRWLREHQGVRETIRVATAKPHVGYFRKHGRKFEDLWNAAEGEQWPLGRAEDVPLSLIEGHHVVTLRFLARFLMADLQLAGSEGDHARMLDDLRMIDRILTHLREIDYYWHIPSSVLRVQLWSLDNLRRAIASSPQAIPVEIQLQIASILEQWDSLDELSAYLRYHHASIDDSIRRSYSDDGRGNGKLLPRLIPGNERLFSKMLKLPFVSEPVHIRLPRVFNEVVLVVATADRVDLWGKVEEILQLARDDIRTPVWIRKQPYCMQRIATDEQQLKYRLVLPYDVAYGIARYRQMRQQVLTERDGILVGFALLRFHQAQLRWPERLEELVTGIHGHLKSVPLDPFDELPLRYQLRDGKPVVYSIGTDLKDDLGQRATHKNFHLLWTDDRHEITAPENQGDWILWEMPAK